MVKQARDWPVAEGSVLDSEHSRNTDGVLNVTLIYTYKVHGDRFNGRGSFTFTSEDDAKRFESGCRERKLKVHYRQDNPGLCVAIQR
jgi:hypothetical protein